VDAESCTGPKSQPLDSASAVGAVDLVDPQRAIVVSAWRSSSPRSLDVALRDHEGTTLETVVGVTVEGMGAPWLFVAGGTESALLINGEEPLLLSL
jgi:hypothetical protein